MLLKKEVGKDGNITISIDKKPLDHILSRELTGTTGEKGYGVFEHESVTETFEFGDFKAAITFEGTYNYCWQMEDLAPAIFARIEKVRDWVEDCKDSGGEVEDGKNRC